MSCVIEGDYALDYNVFKRGVRELFGGFGNVLEVIFLKDKRTGLPQGCCFIKYANAMEAERAIRALDNQRTLPGGPAPLQVKFADGEREHSGPTEYKLFVGSLNRQAGEQEIEEIFAPYGRVENVYVIRDEQKQSRGCAFITFPERDMAIAAISALNGIYKMAGCHQPIIVRFADPKRPRSGERETRMGGSGSNFSPRSHHGGSGMTHNSHPHIGAGGLRGSGGPAMEGHNASFGWRQGGAGGMGLLPQAGILPLGGSAPARKGHLDGPNSAMSIRGDGLSTQGAPAISGQPAISNMGSQLSQPQVFNEVTLQKPFGQPHSTQQSALQQFPPNSSQHSQSQPIQGYPLTQSTDTRLQQQVSVGQHASSQPSVQAQMYSQTSVSHPALQQQVVSSMPQPRSMPSPHPPQYQPLRAQDSQASQQMQMAQSLQQAHQFLSLQPLQPQVSKSNLQPLEVVNQSNQQAATLQPAWSIPVQQYAIPSQQQALLAQQPPVVSQPQALLLQQQTGLSPQQAGPLQQQAVPLQQQANLSLQQQAAPLQQAAVSLQQHAVPSIASPVTTTVSATSVPMITSCDWTEHTSPDGHKYYYNSKTGESRWEKPEEFAAFERQQQLASQQQQQQQQQFQQMQQSQLVQAHLQTHIQPLQSNPLYQQQQLVNHQSQQAQPYQQQSQPQLQQLQRPQLHQLPQPHQLQQQVQLQQVQHPQTQLHQQFPQVPSSGAYQAVQGFAHVQQPAGQTANGIVDASRVTQVQQVSSNQQVPAANGVPDAARSAQWMPAIQQGLLNQDWMWKSKPAGS
ncbi:hypothetical protein L7F22_027403 [Adiantum nelumboides]|nr:hypothetical protein [Adiantum nelumboides]